ncbi:MAG: hypothetical protein ACREAE_01460, partial [Nitrosopumilaceae archaeon]
LDKLLKLKIPVQENGSYKNVQSYKIKILIKLVNEFLDKIRNTTANNILATLKSSNPSEAKQFVQLHKELAKGCVLILKSAKIFIEFYSKRHYVSRLKVGFTNILKRVSEMLNMMNELDSSYLLKKITREEYVIQSEQIDRTFETVVRKMIRDLDIFKPR